MILTTFSEDRRYRYTLMRDFQGLLLTSRRAKYVNFVMLNPSTADESANDPTVARCIRFAKDWGYDGLYVTNLFALRSTDPRALYAAEDPIGPENDHYIEEVAVKASLIIAAWGAHGQRHGRSTSVRRLLGDYVYCLRMGKKEPWHPLYLPAASKPQLIEEALV
jgi:hypothetical protein